MAKIIKAYSCAFEVGDDFEKTVKPNGSIPYNVICKGSADDILKVIADLERVGYRYVLNNDHPPYISSITKWMVMYSDRDDVLNNYTYGLHPIAF